MRGGLPGAVSIAYAGAPGAFGELACIARFPGHRHTGLAGFAEVVEAVALGYVENGLIPLRNSHVGEVPGVAALLNDPVVRVVEEMRLPVAMHCLGPVGAALSGVREVHSHPVALRQSARFLAAGGLKAVEARDTAQAARMVAERGDPAVAALASGRAAELYGLVILAADVQNAVDNVTTFAVIARA